MRMPWRGAVEGEEKGRWSGNTARDRPAWDKWRRPLRLSRCFKLFWVFFLSTVLCSPSEQKGEVGLKKKKVQRLSWLINPSGQEGKGLRRYFFHCNFFLFIYFLDEWFFPTWGVQTLSEGERTPSYPTAHETYLWLKEIPVVHAVPFQWDRW